MGAGAWWGSVQKGWSNQGALILWKGWFLCLKCRLSLPGFSWQVQKEHQSLVYCAPNHVHQDPADTLQASDQVGRKHYWTLTCMLTLQGSNGAFSEGHKLNPGCQAWSLSPFSIFSQFWAQTYLHTRNTYSGTTEFAALHYSFSLQPSTFSSAIQIFNLLWNWNLWNNWE